MNTLNIRLTDAPEPEIFRQRNLLKFPCSTVFQEWGRYDDAYALISYVAWSPSQNYLISGISYAPEADRTAGTVKLLIGQNCYLHAPLWSLAFPARNPTLRWPLLIREGHAVRIQFRRREMRTDEEQIRGILILDLIDVPRMSEERILRGPGSIGLWLQSS